MCWFPGYRKYFQLRRWVAQWYIIFVSAKAVKYQVTSILDTFSIIAFVFKLILMSKLLTVSLRQQAIYIPAEEISTGKILMRDTTGLLAANLAKLGFALSEPLLHALNNTTPAFQANILETVKDIAGVNKNWTPLVKGWNMPTGETVIDHLLTFFANVFKTRGTTLACGHIIPEGSFPLERYTGCPFCGTPFEFGAIEHYKQGSMQKVLQLWTREDAADFLRHLLQSKTALDATQTDSLKLLLAEFPLPGIRPKMKETLMAVIDICIEQGKMEQAQAFFTTPVDILRYLWYKHTGFLQLFAPETIVRRKTKNDRIFDRLQNNSGLARLEAKANLRLNYSRKHCLMVAGWLNALPQDTATLCEMMHPKRGMWVRFIRALRLPEYSKRQGFENLRELLDKFYNQDYTVWQGQVATARFRHDPENTLRLLQQRPGLFARSLFANMLWFGTEPVLAAFAEVTDMVPARLLFTLDMYAENYFDKTVNRVVKPLGGTSKRIPANRFLAAYDDAQLAKMRDAVRELCISVVKKRFSRTPVTGKTMYIDPALFKIPLAIGDRSDTIQDTAAALMGMRFPVEGQSVRLFMQWGVGLPAQHMDMDLSCLVAYKDSTDYCSYANLHIRGCRHSGDIRSIPDKIGTAEYIELDLKSLKAAGAQYVVFSCNAFSAGEITPNLVVGWMNSRYPMKISEKTGVAYDPSCVQHQVRVVKSLSKGLVFGILDVSDDEIIWLEQEFGGQVIQQLDGANVSALLKKLESKMSIGQLLQIKSEAQHLAVVDTIEADEVYTVQWALDTAAVTRLFVE
jgi:hypothetical protein